MWSGFFSVVDQRMELLNHLHEDLAALGTYFLNDKKL